MRIGTVIAWGMLVVIVVVGLGMVLVRKGTSRTVVAQVPGPELIIYSQPDFQGRELVVTGSLADLPREELVDGSTFDWNDNIRSLRVLRGTWRVYQNGRFNTSLDETPLEDFDPTTKARAPAWSCLLSPKPQGAMEHSDGAVGGWASDISSIELVTDESLPDWATTLPGSD